jgi:hypothetical protein
MRIKEILVLHHSHLDVGYTHSQPVLWEMQREYLDQALVFLEQTADWPEPSRPKWMCEVTAPVLKWLETADGADLSRFTGFARQGRIAIGALRYNITPLNTADQLARQLEPVAELRRRLGTPIVTAIQHDVNGVPWPLTDLLLDRGVELLVMGTNNHCGNPVAPRPGIFRWRTPTGRELRVMNGHQYTMFDQIFLTWKHSLDAMRRGFDQYAAHLERIGYPHDFLYLTTTSTPEMWDNSPPNLSVAKLIRQWNETGHQPDIRYVTTEDLLERIRRIPAGQLPLLAGDWTDYWNFGCASTAGHVARSRAAKRALDAADRLAVAPRSAAVARVAARARDLLDRFNEHTWSSWDTADRADPAFVQDHLKAALAVEARELAGYVLTNELETLAHNPAHSETPPDQVLFVNPSPVARAEYVHLPTAWRDSGPRLRSERFKPVVRAEVETVGPIDLPAFGTKRVPLASLQPASDDVRLRHEDRQTPVTFRAFNKVRIENARTGDARLESPTHRLTYDPSSGRILGLFDKTLGREILAANAEYDFFDFVRERPDALADGRREAFYERDLEREKFDQSCWKPWRVVRERATRLIDCRVERTAGAMTLDRRFEAPGTAGLRQRITLRADSPVIELEVELDKTAGTAPEAFYFVLPLNLMAGWRCHFDTAGFSVALDEEQLPGACRGWLTVESYVALHTEEWGATLFCPDAPLVMPGDFHFGPPLESVPRPANPLLLAWPLNNYWNTNFPLSQPGRIRLRYGLRTHGPFDAAEAGRQAAAFANPILAHPLFSGNDGETPRA